MRKSKPIPASTKLGDRHARLQFRKDFSARLWRGVDLGGDKPGTLRIVLLDVDILLYREIAFMNQLAAAFQRSHDAAAEGVEQVVQFFADRPAGGSVDHSNGFQSTLEVFYRMKNHHNTVVRIYNQFSPSAPIIG